MKKGIKKEMTEAEAWLIVAEEFQAGRTSSFLCLVLSNAGSRSSNIDAISYELRGQMRRFVKCLLGGQLFAYSMGEDDMAGGEQFEARLTALCLFAAMAKTGDTVTF